jgi:hypothetical protein
MATGRWFKVLCGLAAIGLAYGFLFYKKQSANAPVTPGWNDPAGCSYMASLDGEKELLLFENHFVRKYETTGDRKSIEGTWSFDEDTQQYSVILDGVTTRNSLIRPRAAHFCMLINGNLETADLTRSWFTSDVDPRDFDYSPDPDISARY